MKLDYSQICRRLKQGHPMVLVDRVMALVPGESATGIKAITGSEPCYQELDSGLGPESCAYPNSLILESFGQTAALLWLETCPGLADDADDLIMFAAARNCRFMGRAYPADVLHHTACLGQIVGNNVFVEGETSVNGRTILTVGTMIAVRRPLSLVVAGSESLPVQRGEQSDS